MLTWLKKLFNGIQAVGRFITRQINLVLVGLVYFIAVFPIAMILRLSGRDLLDVGPAQGRASFWLPKEPTPAELERFRRQF